MRLVLVVSLLFAACGTSSPPVHPPQDTGVLAMDAGTLDAAEAPDLGAAPDAAETADLGSAPDAMEFQPDAEPAADALGAPDAAPAADAGFMDATEVPEDAGTPDSGGFTIGAHPPLTQVPYLGGPILQHPELILISYADDPNVATLEADARWLVGSSWLTAVGSEYGVSSGSVMATVRSSSRAPTRISDTQIQAMLTAGLRDQTIPSPPNGDFSNALYVIYYPSSTQVLLDEGGRTSVSCQDFGGYHFEATGPSGPFSYAVIPNCPGFFPGLSDVESEELAFSHEVIEAATDALPYSRPGYTVDPAGDSPLLLVGGEVTDLCAQSTRVYREGNYVASLSYSNAAAALGDRDPCIPGDPPPPYYLAMTDPEHLQVVRAGSSIQLQVDAWSNVPMPDWSVQALPQGTFNVGVSLSASRMNNGRHATLTLSVPAGTQPGNYAVIYLVSAVSQSDFHLAYTGVIVE